MSHAKRTPFKRQPSGESNHSQNGQATNVVEMPIPSNASSRTFENKDEFAVQGNMLKTKHLIFLTLNRPKPDGRGFSIAEQKLRTQIREKLTPETDTFELSDQEVGYLQNLMQIVEFPFESPDLIGFVENFGK